MTGDDREALAMDTPCIETTWWRNPNGYGVRVRGRDGRNIRAHRAAWEQANGPIPDGLHVCHRCDNPPCVNPAHLFLGTPADNAADRVAKGRSAKGDRHGYRVHPERHERGEAHHSAKLTDQDVREIRSLVSAGLSQRSVAARFGVAQTSVAAITKGRTWSHVK